MEGSRPEAMKGAVFGVAAIAGVAYLLTRKDGDEAPASFIAQGASGRSGGATWEVFTDDLRGGYAYRVNLPQGETVTTVEYSGEPFAGLREAIKAAEADAAELCASPVFDCNVEEAPEDTMEGEAEFEDESPFEPAPDLPDSNNSGVRIGKIKL